MGAVHFIGDVTTAYGLSEAGLNTLEVLSQHVPTKFSPLKYAGDIQDQPGSRAATLFKTLPTNLVCPVSILYYNINEFHLLSDSRLAELTKGGYKIAVWFWELEQVPVWMRSQIDRVDEIWVASSLAQHAFRQHTRNPVRLMPVPVALSASSSCRREQFSLPDDRYVFMFHFSASSCDGRKNPWSVIDAFEQAFGAPGPDGPMLVMKVQHADRYPALRAALHQAMARVGGVVIEQNYSRQQMNDLLASADAYVSLHRAEGFGLGMAEAMSLGKPVIATHYSANADFMSADNSYPVRYHLRLIEPRDFAFNANCQYVYELGQLWAEPDRDHAADLMRLLYEHPDAGRAIGRRAAASIRNYCSPDVVGRRMKQRLDEIAAAKPQHAG